MKVKELIEQLQKFDADTPVKMAYYEPGYDGMYIFCDPYAVLGREGYGKFEGVCIVHKDDAKDAPFEEYGAVE